MSGFQWYVSTTLAYADENEDFTIRALCATLDLDYDDKDDCRLVSTIIREAKDQGADDEDEPMELCYVYERPGWWTTNPETEVRFINRYRSLMRNGTEQHRNEQLDTAFAPGSFHRGVTLSVASNLRTGLQIMEAQMPDPDRDDPCLERIDDLIAHGMWSTTGQ